MLEHLEFWLRYTADGPWWALALFLVGVASLGVVVGTLIRDWLSQ